MDKKPIRVLLADDTLIAREGLKIILETAADIQVIDEVNHAQQTLNKVKELSPDVLLMDLKWFGDDTAGWTAIKEVKAYNPQIKVIALTAYENLIRDARLAGADAALTKTFSREDLLNLIRELVTRQENFPVVKHEVFHQIEELTAREREVLKLVAAGSSDKEIALELGIATATAKNHVKKILEKFGVRNRIQAANLARERGLV